MLIMNKWKLNWGNCGCLIFSLLIVSLICGFVVFLFSTAILWEERSWGGEIHSARSSADRTPQWSIDGQILVVNIGDGIHGVDIQGNKLWQIPNKSVSHSVSGRYSPALSTNGEVAYVLYFTEDRFLGNLFHFTPYRWRIELTNVNGTEIDRLFSKRRTTVHNPVWSPNGSSLAFSADGNLTIMTKRELGLWSRLPSILTFWRKYDNAAENWVIKHPVVWSNDGQRIAYIDSSVIYNDYTDEYDISVDRIVNMQWDGADEKIAMEQQSRRDEFRPARFEPTSLAWSATDDRIYFVYYELADGEDAGYTPSVRSARPDGSDERIIAVWTEGFRVKGLKLSPDGSQLLFTTHRSPKDFDERISDEELYVMNIDGSETKKVFEPLDYVYSWGTIYASWSPDGSRIAVHDLGHGGNVFTISPDGSDARLVIGPGVQPGYGKPLPEAAGR